MITIRKSEDRGHADYGWLNTYHTFSFGRYYDPKHTQFRTLRVMNDDIIAPGKGFGTHPHDNMEIISYVVSGALAHKDSTGTVETLRPGEVQRMTAGSGIEHSEFNPSPTEPTRLIQIWIFPKTENLKPGYEQKAFPMENRRGRLALLASPDGTEGSVTVQQDVRLYGTVLGVGEKVALELKPGRHAWVQVVSGAVDLNGKALSAGDGAAISEEKALNIRGEREAELIVFDLA
jgi:redox-sensitive bicupin YhaK (pirin superfamily)